MSTANQEISTTILNQLTQSRNGSSRLGVMIGAHTFLYGVDDEGRVYVTFKWKMRGSKNKSNYCKIILEKTDTYLMEFYSIRGLKCTIKSEIGYVYCDQLKSVFEHETGFALSL